MFQKQCIRALFVLSSSNVPYAAAAAATPVVGVAATLYRLAVAFPSAMRLSFCNNGVKEGGKHLIA